MPSTAPDSLENTLRDLLDTVPGTSYLINPPPHLLHVFVQHAYTRETLPTIRVFATHQVFTDTFTDFKTSSKAAELTSNHTIGFRVASFNSPPCIIYDNTVLALIHHYLLSDTNQQLASDIHEMVSNNWDQTTEYSLSVPPLSTLYNSLTTTFGSDLLLDAKALLDAADSHTIDLPFLILLIGLRHNITFVELADWAESIDLTSRATLSRYRRILESHNLLESRMGDTTTGRPPLHLHAVDNRLTDDPARALAALSETLSE